MAYKSVRIQLATHNYYWFFTLVRLNSFSWVRDFPQPECSFSNLRFFLFQHPTPTNQHCLPAALWYFLTLVLVCAPRIPPGAPTAFLYPSPNAPILLNPACVLWNLTLPASVVAHHPGLLWPNRSGLRLLRQTQLRIYLSQFTWSLEHNLMLFNGCWVTSHL